MVAFETKAIVPDHLPCNLSAPIFLNSKTGILPPDKPEGKISIKNARRLSLLNGVHLSEQGKNSDGAQQCQQQPPAWNFFLPAMLQRIAQQKIPRIKSQIWQLGFEQHLYRGIRINKTVRVDLRIPNKPNSTRR